MTTGRTPAEAVNNYRRDVQRPLSCVTDGVVGVDGGYYPSPHPHFLTMSSGWPATLGGPSRLRLRVQQNYRIVESGLTGDGRQVAVVGYNYAVFDAELTEVLLYHWHPIGNRSIATPHLYLRQGAEVGRAEVRNAHLPTGNVTLNAVLRVLIEEMEVQPRGSDWDSILAE